jgi:2-methylcitrate dehydratase PrpD
MSGSRTQTDERTTALVFEQGAGTTATLSDWISRTTFSDLSPEAVHAAKRLICDCIGCAIGARGLESANIVTEVAAEMGGPPEATVMGGRIKVGAAAAAFANATLGNALDADDTLYNRAHYAVAAVFPALALGERLSVGGPEMITAVTLGYDVGARLMQSLTFDTVDIGGKGQATGLHFGWISFAAVAAAARMLRLDAVQMANAIGIAGWTSPLPCSLRWQHMTSTKPMLKYTPMGFMSQQGVLAAQLAGKGFTGDPDLLDGETGYWKLAGSTKCDWNAIVGDLGKHWSIQDVSFKPYALCRKGNPIIDLFRRIVAEHGLRPDEIAKVSAWTVVTGAKDWSDYLPQTQTDMAFSIKFALAASAYGMDLGPRWQSWEVVRDPRLPEFARRVELLPNTDIPTTSGQAAPLAALDGLVGVRRPTQVEVHARNQVFGATTDFAWGDPLTSESAMTDEDLKQKYRTFCSGVLRSERIEESLEVIFRLDEVADLSRELMSLLS